MPIDFPNSPINGQEFTSGATTWAYNGTAWDLKTTTTTSNDSMPVGSIMWFAGTTAPTGWVLCNGATYTNSTYPNLVAVIGTTFGGTPGTNFMVPNISATTGAYYIRFTTAVGVTSTLSLLSAPVGSMVQWPVTSSYPTGWLRCDGSNISRTSFADLFALIGTTYGTGDNSTTFTLPNISAAGTGSPVYIIKATTSGLIEPSTVAHAASHTEGGSDVITVTGNQIANYQSNRSRIINGDARVAQRGNTFIFNSGGGNNYYPVDRFYVKDYTWSGASLTVGRETSIVPSGFSNSIRVVTGVAGLTFNSGGWLGIAHKIEGYNVADLYNKSITLSFWVRSSVTGTYSVAFANKDLGVTTPDRVYVAAYTINAANTWEFKTITTSLATATVSGTWNTTNGVGLHIEWGLGSHSDRRTDTYNSNWANWSSIGWQRTTQTQWATNSNSTFYLAGVQLEQGSVATPFEFEPFETTLRKCQRYFYKSYPQNVYFGARNVDANREQGEFYFNTNAAPVGGMRVMFPVEMRAIPTVDFAAWDTTNLNVADAGSFWTHRPGVGNYTATLDRKSPTGVTVRSTAIANAILFFALQANAEL